MKAKVNKNSCIGCGACVATCPEVFDFGDDGLAEAKVNEVSKENEEAVIEAEEGCPTSAIEVKKEEK